MYDPDLSIQMSDKTIALKRTVSMWLHRNVLASSLNLIRAALPLQPDENNNRPELCTSSLFVGFLIFVFILLFTCILYKLFLL